jgi:hypothetical protein
MTAIEMSGAPAITMSWAQLITTRARPGRRVTLTLAASGDAPVDMFNPFWL